MLFPINLFLQQMHVHVDLNVKNVKRQNGVLDSVVDPSTCSFHVSEILQKHEL